MVHFKPDDKVWVKLGEHPWWPAIVVPNDYEKASKNVFRARDGEDTLVLFYGTADFSWINQQHEVNIVDFDSHIDDLIKSDRSRIFRDSVKAAQAGEDILGDIIEDEDEDELEFDEEAEEYGEEEENDDNDDGDYILETKPSKHKKKSKPSKSSSKKRTASSSSREEPPKKKPKTQTSTPPPPPQSTDPYSSPVSTNPKKRVERCKEVLESAIKNNSSSNIRHCLNRLEKTPVTVDILQSTLIGKVVNKITKKKYPELSQRAKALVNSWKEQVQSNNQSASPSPSPSSTSVKSPTKTQPPKPSPSNGKTSVVQNKSEGNNKSSPTRSPPSQDSQNNISKPKSSQNSSSKLNETPAQLRKTGVGRRDVVLRKFYFSLVPGCESDEEHCCRRAESIEQALCDKYGASSSEYRSEYMVLVSNLKRNVNLREQVLSGHLDPNRLVNMSAEEMMTSEQQQQVEKDYEYNKKKAMNHKKLEASTDRFKCGRCKKRQTTYHQMQTRSADEPMTTFVTCVNCGNNWKFS